MFSKLIKIAINCEYYFSKPRKNKFLIYDRHSKRFAKTLFGNSFFTYYDVRYESVNIYVLLFTIINNGLKNIKLNYKINYFNFVQPKIIYTSIDNNPGFFKLKDIFPKALYIADQNGIRNNIFFNECKKYLKDYPKKRLFADVFFCYGTNEKKRISKIIQGKIYPLGNTLNNNFKKPKVIKNYINKIIYISQDPKIRFKLEKSIFVPLLKFCEDKNLKLFFLDRPNQNNKLFIEKKFAKNFYYIGTDLNKLNSYNKFDLNSLYVNGHSTLGYEMLSKGYKCAFFNHNFYKHGIKNTYPSSGFFWTKRGNKIKMNQLLNKIINISHRKWLTNIKKYQKELMYYDSNNLTKKKIISNLI